MSLQTDYDLQQDSKMRQRTSSALIKSARDIINESPATPNHAARLAWADTVTGVNAALAQTDQKAMIWVAANPTISAAYETGGETAVPDADLLFVFTSEVLPRLLV